MSSRRILYVGHNLALLQHLQGELASYRVVRCPSGSMSLVLLNGINYSLLLFDEELPDTTGLELAEFACSLARMPCTPLIIVKKQDNFALLLKVIMEVFTA